MKNKYVFNDIVIPKIGFLRGPFGGDLKKSLFVEKSPTTYKVYEQGVVLNSDESIGQYYISEEYFKNKMSKFEVLPGDFLVSCSGVNYGAIYRMSRNIEKGIINQALLRIRLNENLVDPNYFLYYFKNYIVKKITGGTGDSTIPNFPPMEFVKNIEIELPDIEEQRKIGKFLSLIDKKIKNNKKLNKKIDKMINEIYVYWFKNYNFPDENGNPYRENNGEMVYSSELKTNIPKGWKVQDLKNNDLSQIIKPGVEYFEQKRYLITANIENGEFTPGKLIDFKNRENRANMQPIKNSIWFAKMKNSIKHLTLTNNSSWFFDNYIISTGMLGIECKCNSLSYLHSVINYKYFEQKKDKLAHGATQEAINNEDLKYYKLLIPDQNTLDNYTKATYDLLQKKNNIIHENLMLEEYLNFVSPLLIIGQIRI